MSLARVKDVSVIGVGTRVGHRMQGLAGTLLGKEGTDGVESYLLRSSVGMLALRVVARGLHFAIGVALARTLGVSGFGTYALALAWVTLLAVPLASGVNTLIVRQVGAYRANSEWGSIAGVLRWTNLVALGASLAVAATAALVAWALSQRLDGQVMTVIWVALFLVPILVLTLLRQGAMQGLQRVVAGHVPDSLVFPVLFLLLLGSAYFGFGGNLTATQAMALNVGAAAAALAVGMLFLSRSLPPDIKGAKRAYESRQWTASLVPLVLIGAMSVVNYRADAIMLGAIKGPEAVGIYAVAARSAELVLFATMAVNPALTPAIASLYARGDIGALQGVVTKATRATFLLALPVAVALVVFGPWFLLLYGAEFTEGRTALAVLAGAQLAVASMAAVVPLLTMTGNERYATAAMGASVVINLALNAILIPRWGVEGAAVATATSLAVWIALMAVGVHRRVGVQPTAFARLGRSK